MPLASLNIDLTAIVKNYQLLADKISPAICTPVVKCNGYGLGATQVATALHSVGARCFYVAHTEEGMALRNALPDGTTIRVLHGVHTAEEASACLAHQLEPVLNHPGQWDIWHAAATRHNAPLHATVHLDTGMHRLGFTVEQLQRLASQDTGALSITTLMSHFASADEPDNRLHAQQYERLMSCASLWPQAKRSLCNSSGIFLQQNYHLDEARPGMALYGLNPTPTLANPMQNVVTLTTPLLQIRTADYSGTVGYNGTYPAPKGAVLGILPVGYGDGILRALGNKTHLMLHTSDGQQFLTPIAGRISMDLLTIDVSHVPASVLNERAYVELLGPQMDVSQLAQIAGTASYELFVRLGERFNRQYRQ